MPGKLRKGAQGHLEDEQEQIGVETVDLSSLKKYDALLRALPDMMFAISSEGMFIDFRAERDSDLLIPPEDIVGKHVRDVGFTKRDEKAIMKGIADALKTGDVQTVEYQLKVSGQIRTYESRFVAMSNSEVVSIVRDITDRVRASVADDEHREFLRQVIDINPNFVFAKDAEGRFTLVNQAVADNYGTTVDELTGKRDADFNPYAEEVDHFRKDDLEVIKERKEKIIPEEIITDAEGSRRWLQTVKRPLVGRDGKVQVLGVAVDITRYKLAEEKLRHATDELREERTALYEKNAALTQILNHFEDERKHQRRQIAREIEQAVLPELRRLKRKADRLTPADLEELEAVFELAVKQDEETLKDRYESLSPREAEICNLIRDGMSSKQISDHLNLSPLTVHKHRERIRRKLGLTNMRLNLTAYLRSGSQ